MTKKKYFNSSEQKVSNYFDLISKQFDQCDHSFWQQLNFRTITCSTSQFKDFNDDVWKRLSNVKSLSAGVPKNLMFHGKKKMTKNEGAPYITEQWNKKNF